MHPDPNKFTLKERYNFRIPKFASKGVVEGRRRQGFSFNKRISIPVKFVI